MLLIACFVSDYTPLHLTVDDGHVEVVKLLLSCNAAVDARDQVYRPYRCVVDEISYLIFCRNVPLIFAPDTLFL